MSLEQTVVGFLVLVLSVRMVMFRKVLVKMVVFDNVDMVAQSVVDYGGVNNARIKYSGVN